MLQIDYEKWRGLWAESEMFAFKPSTKKPLYVIDTPPPFTSGDLHLGQVFWVVYTDSIARYMRMKGYEVLYPIGWDTQGFPTELAAEKKYGKLLSREDFYEKCTGIAKANMGSMKKQMRKIGATFDEEHEYVTMSEQYRRKVQLSLLIMYDKGFVYRAKHPVEWCRKCNTSIAREETEERDRDSTLNYIEFSFGKKKFEIATTRPEMLHSCVAIAVNPSDPRYREIVGKMAALPIFKRKVRIIADEIVDKGFGTGAEMVCTFGDKNDVMLFYKHKLDYIEAISGQGLMVNSGKYDGISAEEARRAIIKDLKGLKLLKRQEQTKQTVKVHDKCGTVTELISAMQWFIRTKEHSGRIKRIGKEIDFIPESKRQNLNDWADFIEWDWNISRNRIFGTPIPFWYCNGCGFIIPAKKESLPVNPAVSECHASKCPKCGSSDIAGEKETCDVWVDSSITPMVVAGWPDDMQLFNRAFPATLRIQGSDIIRTWAFYTILRTWALTGSKPFEKALIHGMILGPDGREMHKSLGNGVSPDDLLGKYGIDSIRLWAALTGSIGKDKLFSYEELNYSNSFINKLYNSALFVRNACAETKVEKAPKSMGIFDMQILDRLNEVIKEVEEDYERLDLYAAMMKLMNFYWHEFCDFYIENVKYRIHSEDKKLLASKKAAVFTLMRVLEGTLVLLSPVIPFAAEEINAMFSKRSIFLSKLPKYAERPAESSYVVNGVLFSTPTPKLDHDGIAKLLNSIISDVRKAKSTQRIALNKEITSINIYVPKGYHNALHGSANELMQICKAKAVNIHQSKDYSVNIKA